MSEVTLTSLRSAARRGYFKAQFDRTAKNRARRMRRHLRAHPADENCARLYAAMGFGEAKALSPSCQGHRRLTRGVFLATLRTRAGVFRSMAKWAAVLDDSQENTDVRNV